MTDRHLIVCQRDNAWLFTLKGTITAPFQTREAAVKAAIAEARAQDDPQIEVIVQDQDMTQETVWRRQDGE
ncbi:MAG: DUF2188 domain-containing protein [Devosia sp.]|uniref:DUF2188 domain-containing protein n=1 Tax=Devosia sp. TaxID=1871048 RepID=UPI0024CC943D|nr:DUF2188 domain-containing protein [Devosia sp.]UYO00010.1 MAG: DUF2188 domain-containing protein [Devosia sp.]